VNPGDLIWVQWEHKVWHQAIILRIRENMNGGSCIQTTRMQGSIKSYSEIIKTEIQSQVLVQLIDDDGISWVDEVNIITPEKYLTIIP
jgi:hypothetical protein